jgi:hypothetical protein
MKSEKWLQKNDFLECISDYAIVKVACEYLEMQPFFFVSQIIEECGLHRVLLVGALVIDKYIKKYL